MIHTSAIRKSLCFLNEQYTAFIGSREKARPVMFAKLAVLEYCGWLEESIDDIARNCVRRTLRTRRSRDLLEQKIKTTHGFLYLEHVRPLMAYALGTVRLLELEKDLAKDGSLDILKTNLSNMHQSRGRAAHTFTRGATSSYDAPSNAINNFEQTSPILLEMWNLVAINK